MTLAQPHTQTIKDLIAAEEQRADLQQELTALELRISVLRQSMMAGGAPLSQISRVTPAAGKVRRGRNSPKGTYRDHIMAALEAAGSVGVRVKEIAESMRTKPVNIHAWFHANLKRIPGLKKIAGGHYSLAAGAKSEGASSSARPLKTNGRRFKTKGTKRGALSASIMEQLRSVGTAGIKIADLAERIGAKYKNVYIWFATTGKKNRDIKRIAPATYSLSS